MTTKTHVPDMSNRKVGSSRLVESAIDAVLDDRHDFDSHRELVGDHARLLAHEIRGHLGVLNGYIAMLEDGSLGKLPPRARGAVPEMRAKARAIAHLVDDLLEDARLNDGQIHLAIRTADLKAIVAQSVDEARPSLPANHSLVAHLPSEPVFALVDRGRIAIILRNLIDNAVKYSPDGGQVDCHLEHDATKAVIYVADRGLGVPMADSEAIFHRFGRGSQRDRIAGVGLGLYISRRLAELHGGEIVQRPRAGGGSVFRLTLPLA
ncbi:MAG TPA: ATP-binding protein [Candidatus Dormibacteraeota bacterium]